MSFWDDHPGAEWQLPALWDEGLSASIIGKRLGCSRNAVIGKAHRMNLSPRPSPLHPKLTEDDVRVIRATGGNIDTTFGAIAEIFGITRSHAANVFHGRVHKRVA